MTVKRIVRIVLLLFVVASASFLIAKEYGSNAFRDDVSPAPEAATHETTPAEEEGPDRVVLYYFHGHRRCYTCRTIEAYLAEAIENFFSQEIASGKIVWLPVNVEEARNRHFIKDFGLVSSSAVIAEVKGGKVEQSKSLDMVWQLVRNKPVFMEYVRNETEGFLGKGGGDE